MSALYKIHEIVKITSSSLELDELTGVEAVILSKRETLYGWEYTLQRLDIWNDFNILECNLESTGRMLKSKINFNENVKIISSRLKLTDINNEKGMVDGMVMTKSGWYYSVSILATGISWCVYEDELVLIEDE